MFYLFLLFVCIEINLEVKLVDSKFVFCRYEVYNISKKKYLYCRVDVEEKYGKVLMRFVENVKGRDEIG